MENKDKQEYMREYMRAYRKTEKHKAYLETVSKRKKVDRAKKRIRFLKGYIEELEGTEAHG